MATASAGPVCGHLDQATQDVAPDSPDSCTDCVAQGMTWVHLRECQSCGHIGCCDSSVGKHASAHAAGTSHPLMRSYEPGETWWWCFEDQLAFEIEGAGPARATA